MSLQVSSVSSPSFKSEYGILGSREKATKFVYADDKTVDKITKKAYVKAYKEDNKKFDKKVDTTLKALPAVAVASGLAMGRGMKGSLLSGVSWGLALVAPTIVTGIDKAIGKANPEFKEAEKRNPLTTLVASVTASVGTFFGLTALANKAVKNPKVNQLGNKVGEKLSGVFSEATNKFTQMTDKIKTPEIIKKASEKLASSLSFSTKRKIVTAKNSDFVKGASRLAKNITRTAVKNAPSLIVFGTIGALIGKSISDVNKYRQVKSEVKNEQFKTAKILVKDYAKENKALREENELLTNMVGIPDGTKKEKV